MDTWEYAQSKINELIQEERMKNSPPSKGSVRFFESQGGQFALEVPRLGRPKKGAKFWFSFPPKAPHGVEAELKSPGDGRNTKLNTTPGSRMGKSVGCWSIFVDDSHENPNELIDAILSDLIGAAKSPVPDMEIKSDSATESKVTEGDQKVLESDTASLSTSEREAVVKVRFGQGAFRSSLLEIAGDVCWMSGIEGKELLIASHIQPWAHCEKNPDARGCPNNGLLLSSLWDAAFDSGLVTFDEEWKVISSPTLSESAKRHLGLQEEMFLPEGFRNLLRSQYLAYHRAVVFKR